MNAPTPAPASDSGAEGVRHHGPRPLRQVRVGSMPQITHFPGVAGPVTLRLLHDGWIAGPPDSTKVADEVDLQLEGVPVALSVEGLRVTAHVQRARRFQPPRVRTALESGAAGLGRWVGRPASQSTAGSRNLLTDDSGNLRKLLLEDITFAVEPGEIVAVIGPSGAGKSTLGKALLGLQRHDRGIISYNGKDLSDDGVETLRRVLGYVPQDDILHHDLTVRSALEFTSDLRSPHRSLVERSTRVRDVLRWVGLTDQQADTKIGDLSGGQRKRASVAVELLTGPPVILLDEPTTGLDPDTEFELMTALLRLAEQARKTIIVVTHSLAVLERCQRVLVLGTDENQVGRLAFAGRPAELHGYFGTDGDDNELFKGLRRIDPTRFPASPKYRTNIEEPLLRARSHFVLSAPDAWAKPARQAYLLTKRTVRAATNGKLLGLLLGQAPVMAALLLLVLGTDNFDGGPGSSPRQLITFLTLAALSMGLLDACRELVGERSVYRRERAVGLSLGAYLTSKLAWMAALSLWQSAWLTLVVLLQGGRSGLLLGRAGETFLLLTLIILTAAAFGLLLSAWVDREQSALVLVPVVLVFQLLATGSFLSVEERVTTFVPAVATPAYWAFSALAASHDMLEVEGRCAADGGQLPLPAGSGSSVAPSITCSPRWQHAPSEVVLSSALLGVQAALATVGTVLLIRRRDAFRS